MARVPCTLRNQITGSGLLLPCESIDWRELLFCLFEWLLLFCPCTLVVEG